MKKFLIILLLIAGAWLYFRDNSRPLIRMPRHGFIRSGPVSPTPAGAGESSSSTFTPSRGFTPRPLSDELPKIRVSGS